MDEITQRLDDAEGTGRLEYKRSCLWPLEMEPIKIQSVLIRLANANAEVGGLLHLGREDDGRLVGLVDRTLQAVTPQQIKASEQKLVQPILSVPGASGCAPTANWKESGACQ